MFMLLAGGMRGHSGMVIQPSKHFVPGTTMLTLGSMLAYTGGFKIGMGINLFIAAVVALVTSICTVLLFFASSLVL